MKRLPFFALVILMVLVGSGFTTLSWAADSAQGSGNLPALHEFETDPFNAHSNEEAQSICDQVAKANNKEKCVSFEVTRKGGERPEPEFKTFYCTCK
ncbi:MAG: hypothetical protein M0Z59_02075 [Nitrospiraceae bacterium]|nr:hypothetical protein [Nitrospiraceae bacterium]